MPLASLPPGTAVGPVTLRVRDLERALSFWSGLLGLDAQPVPQGASLHAGDGRAALVRLLAAPEAPSRPPAASGLFHVALRVPDRAALGRALIGLRSEGWPLDGAADHRVSEALYLSDPERNGIEIYADRPRESWRWEGGEVVMATEPLDVRDLLRAAGSASGEAALGPGTEVGHVHLRVSDLARAEAFWGAEGVGFEVTSRRYPGALFLSAAGYHHHVGVNVWGGRATPAPEGAAGLVGVTVRIPDRAALEAVAARLGAEPPHGEPPRVVVRDPDGARVSLELV